MRLSIFSLYFAFSLISFSQPCGVAGNNYLRFLGTPDEDKAFIIEPIDTLGYLVGWSSYNLGIPISVATMLDPCGEVIWQRTLNEDEFGLITGVVYNNGLIYLISYKGNPLGTSLICLNMDGSVAFAKLMTTDFAVYPRRMIPTSDGNLLVCGVSNSSQGAGANDFSIFKMTYSGDLLWKKMIGGSANDFGHNVLEDEGGNYVLCGYTRDYATDVYKGCVIKIDSGGDLLWAREYHFDSGHTQLHSIFAKDGNYYFCGYSDASVLGAKDALLIKTDYNGDLLWSRFYGSAGDDELGFAAESGGDIYITGAVGTDLFGSDLFISKLNDDGSIDDFFTFGTQSDDNYFSAGKSFGFDGVFYGIAYGNSGLLGNTDVLLYRFADMNSLCDNSVTQLQWADAGITYNNFFPQNNLTDWQFSTIPYPFAAIATTSGILCSGTGFVDSILPGNPGSGDPIVVTPPPVQLPPPPKGNEVEFGHDLINVFSPGGDGINDAFTFQKYSSLLYDLSCTIVNRWGNVVGHLNGPNDSWNGTDPQGHPCPDGVYFYTYEGIFLNGDYFSGHGTVHLIGGIH